MPENGLDTSSPATRSRHRTGGLAPRVITDVGQPAVLLIVLPLAVAGHGGYTPARIAWAVVIILTCAATTPAAILYRKWRGQVTSGRHVTERAERLWPLLIGLGTAAVGVAVLYLTGADRDLIAVIWALLTGYIVVNVITSAAKWKVSVHTTTAAACTLILAETFGPAWLAGAVVVAAIGWARTQLRDPVTGEPDHTVPQVIAGAVLGAVIGGTMYALLR